MIAPAGESKAAPTVPILSISVTRRLHACRVGKAATGKRNTRAAMRAGLTDRLWTFADLYDTVME